MKKNYQCHLKCNKQQDDVYGISGKRKEPKKLNLDSVKKAIRLLFGTVTPKQEKELIKIAQEEFKTERVVWFQSSYPDDFNEFLKKYSLDIGKKEITISSDGEIVRYTEDYHHCPQPI